MLQQQTRPGRPWPPRLLYQQTWPWPALLARGFGHACSDSKHGRGDPGRHDCSSSNVALARTLSPGVGETPQPLRSGTHTVWASPKRRNPKVGRRRKARPNEAAERRATRSPSKERAHPRRGPAPLVRVAGEPLKRMAPLPPFSRRGDRPYRGRGGLAPARPRCSPAAPRGPTARQTTQVCPPRGGAPKIIPGGPF